MKRFFQPITLLCVILLGGCSKYSSAIQVKTTVTPFSYKAVYLTKGPGELSVADLKAHPEVVVTLTFDAFKTRAGSKIALWVDKNAVSLVDNNWLNQPPQKYYPLVIVGYNDPLYCFRDTFSIGRIEGPVVDWTKVSLVPGFCTWMILKETIGGESSVLRGYNQKPTIQDILDVTNPLLEEKQEIQQFSFDYDHSPDNIVIYADVQSYPGGGPGPGKECLAAYQPQLRIWGDGLVYLNIASSNESPPFQWEGKFDENKITVLLTFLQNEGFFDSWNPGMINPAGTWFRMGANLEITQFNYEGGDLDPPLYHNLIHDHVLPSLTPLSEAGKIDERIAAILRESEDCYNRIFGTPTP